MKKQVKISSMLQKAREYEAEALRKGTPTPKADFHVCVPTGWMNDPNGFSEYNGEIHLFFQYYPYETIWGPMHWGHVKTKDFIRWENLPAALAPDEEFDGAGCFSGSAIEWQGKHVLAYTGVQRQVDETGKSTDYQMQCIAIGDGIHYEKLKTNPVVTSDMVPDGDSKLDFRDPKIWVDGDTIYMVAANRSKDGSGQILLYKSKDLEKWEFVSVLDKCSNRYGKMWECPDFFELEGEDILIFSPQEMEATPGTFHGGDNTAYICGSYDKQTAVFTERMIRPVDQGLDFYAPQTMRTSDGRRIMIGWLQTWCQKWFDEQDGFCGMMAIPRQLYMKNGLLHQLPVRELEKYYVNKEEVKEYRPGECYQKLDALSGRIQNLDVELKGKDDYIFSIRVAADEVHYTTICYDKGKQSLTFDRTYSGSRRDAVHIRTVKVLTNEEKLTLRMVMDRYSIELFINDGQQALTSIIRTPMDCDGVYMKAHGEVSVDAVKQEIRIV